MSKHRSSASHSFKLVGQRSNLEIEEPANSQQHYHSPKYFNAISTPELVDNSRNKATMADEPNAGIENGNLSDKDIIIALVGPIASGKSSFVEEAAGIEGLSREDLGSGTKEISVFKFPFPGLVDSSVCLVDTPGIDDGGGELSDIFNMICVWFNKTYHKEIGLAGLLYFHPISNIQMPRVSSLESDYLKRLCQNELNRVVITTTMWGDVDERTGALREDKLKRLCKPLIDQGLSVKRFLNDSSSACDILHPIVQAASLSRQSTIGRAFTIGRALAIGRAFAISSALAIGSLLGQLLVIMVTESLESRQRYRNSLIVIIGPYGCGKSQFIDTLTQKTAWANHTLGQSYNSVRSVQKTLPNRKGTIVLVDTPGFDDDWKDAGDILKEVYRWSRKNYKNSKVAGFLYLQNVRDNRLTTPSHAAIFEKVGGDNAIRNLSFVTTHWDTVDFDRGCARESRLFRLWEPLLKLGARVERFDKSAKTAWEILAPLLQLESRDMVQLIPH